MRYVGPLIAARLRLLIVDEAHQVVAEDTHRTRVDFAEHCSRSLRLESFVSRLISQRPSIARIALTAVAGGAATPVARWIEHNPEASPIGTNYRSTRQIIGTLETAPESTARISLDLMNGSMLYVRGREDPVFIPLRTPAMPRLPAPMRNSIYRFNQLSMLWTALHLVDRDRRVLISVAQEPEQTMRWFKQALDLPDWAQARQFDQPENVTDRQKFQMARAACADYCGTDSYELALLDWGIATSHGQMPQRLRRLMTELIEKRICKITVATATLTEGVNLPFDVIFVTSLKRRSFDPILQRQVETPLSTAEFRNLSGRAGRPGSMSGMEGMTLIPIPSRPSATAVAQQALQQQQIRNMRFEYDTLLAALLQEEREENAVSSPLTLLLLTLSQRVAQLYGLRGNDFLLWLERTSVADITNEAGMAIDAPAERLADSLDELDSILLTALEELVMPANVLLNSAEAEEFLARLWQHTFSKVASVQEAWLEQAFIRRGQGLISSIYPNQEERRRLYQYGFSPHVGRRFESIAPSITNIITSAVRYADMTPSEQISVFDDIATLLVNDQGFGFRVRATVTDADLLLNWRRLLAWWMQGPDAQSPTPSDLRAWQRFISENIEFRLGAAIGAVVAQAWTLGANDPLSVPSLERWRATTGLPWFGFWARELLRWGTLDPFVAFSLAQGLANTRSEANARYPEFREWLAGERIIVEPDDWIDPQNFLAWQRSLNAMAPAAATENNRIGAELTGTDGRKGRYSVLPVRRETCISWVDSSGFELARSPLIAGRQTHSHKDDFELNTQNGVWGVQRVFQGMRR